MVKPFVSVIIPAYNEGRRLPLTLIDVDRHLSEHDFAYEIIVVTSPSSDNTAEIMRRFPSIIKNLKCISLTENQGKGLAVKTGMLAAKGSWRIVMDADNSTSIVEFNKMRPYFTNKGAGSNSDTSAAYDIVLGSRYVPGAHIEQKPPLLRRVLGSIGRFFLRIFLVHGVRDPNCGFKCFSADSAEKLFTQSRALGWAIDAEVLAHAPQYGYRIKEVPVHYSYDAGTHRTAASYPKIAGEFLHVWWQKLAGKAPSVQS